MNHWADKKKKEEMDETDKLTVVYAGVYRSQNAYVNPSC